MRIVVDENVPNITVIMTGFGQFTEADSPGLLVVMRDTVQSVHRA
jgi:hypothetical protein